MHLCVDSLTSSVQGMTSQQLKRFSFVFPLDTRFEHGCCGQNGDEVQGSSSDGVKS